MMRNHTMLDIAITTFLMFVIAAFSLHASAATNSATNGKNNVNIAVEENVGMDSNSTVEGENADDLAMPALSEETNVPVQTDATTDIGTKTISNITVALLLVAGALFLVVLIIFLSRPRRT